MPDSSYGILNGGLGGLADYKFKAEPWPDRLASAAYLKAVAFDDASCAQLSQKRWNQLKAAA
jgi:hypothetical protein